MKNKYTLKGLWQFTVLASLLVFQSCRKNDLQTTATLPDASTYSSKVATEWMHTLQKVVQSEGSTPPVASRIYAYAAIGLYESVLPGMKGYQSLQGQIPGLSNLPNASSFIQLDYSASANEALYQIATKVFVTLKPENLQVIENLHAKYSNDLANQIPASVISSSSDFGKRVAYAVVSRANNDNFTSTRNIPYAVPSNTINAGFWSPTGAVTNPLEPYWGQIRCFAMAKSDACTIKSSIAFNTTPGTDFYKQANEVLATSQSLTEDQKDIAKWWSDGSSQTATPPGHWVAIVDQLASRNKFDLGKTAEIYAMLNIAMADAFISCWDEKYKLNLLRPVSYIRKYIPGNQSWNPLLATPPFPEYPSGHSVASSAAGEILTKLIGNVTFTDSANTYLGYQPRSYTSFTQAANEAAISRLYGGIHFREAIENGMKQGKEVSKAIFDKIKLRK